MDTYPQLRTLKSCIQEFREIFQKKNMPYLYLFIGKYKNSDLKELSRFASGLKKDLSAVENAVASPLSNGSVEGTNSKLKMIKRTMYGRCGKELLIAKLIFAKRIRRTIAEEPCRTVIFRLTVIGHPARSRRLRKR